MTSPESRGNGPYGPWNGPVCEPYWSANDSQRHDAPIDALERLLVDDPDDEQDEHVEGDERYDDLRSPKLTDDEHNPKPISYKQLPIQWLREDEEEFVNPFTDLNPDDADPA